MVTKEVGLVFIKFQEWEEEEEGIVLLTSSVSVDFEVSLICIGTVFVTGIHLFFWLGPTPQG